MVQTPLIGQMVELQRNTFNQLFDVAAQYQKNLETTNNLWLNAMRVPEPAKDMIDQWRSVCRKTRDHLRNTLNDGFSLAESMTMATQSDQENTNDVASSENMKKPKKTKKEG
jgi:hypothetical protein